MVGNAVRHRPDVDQQPIVHADGEPMFPRLQLHAEIIDMGRAQAVIGPDKAVVNPDAGLPVRAFEGQDDSLALPPRRKVHVALIPSRADVMLFRLEKERDLDMTRLAVFAILRCALPMVDSDIPRPWRVRRNVVSETLILERARQPNALCQRTFKPMFLHAGVIGIQLKPPFSGERAGASVDGQAGAHKERGCQNWPQFVSESGVHPCGDREDQTKVHKLEV